MKSLFALCVLALLAVSGQAFAAAKPAVSAEAFAQVATQIRAQMLPGGKYAGLSASDQRAARNDLNEIQGLMERRGPVTKMNHLNVMRVYNVQEHLNGVLTGDLAQRQFCSSPAIAGTFAMICQTYSQIERSGSGFDSSSIPQSTLPSAFPDPSR